MKKLAVMTVFGAVLAIALGAIDHGAKAQGPEPLQWTPLRNFAELTPGVDYRRDRLLAIINLPGEEFDQNTVVQKLRDVPEMVTLRANKFLLSNAYPIPARASDPSGSKSQVCGKVLIELTPPPGLSLPRAILRVGSLVSVGAVYGVSPNGYGFPSPSGAALPALEAIRLPDVTQSPNSEVRTAVLDTGVTPILGGLTLVAGRNYVTPGIPSSATGDTLITTPTGVTLNGHGTALAGIIGGAAVGPTRVGVVPGAPIVPVKVCSNNGLCLDSSVILGLCYAVSSEAQARVVNLSLGGYVNSPILAGAIRDANQEQALVVASIGNTRDGLIPASKQNALLFPAGFVANDPSVIPPLAGLIAVGAVSEKVSGASTFPYAPYATTNASVGIVAPGTMNVYNHLGVFDPTTVMSGTSYATGLVSGAAAMLWSKAPGLGMTEIKARILNYANPAGCTPTTQCGSGLLDLQNAWDHTP